MNLKHILAAVVVALPFGLATAQAEQVAPKAEKEAGKTINLTITGMK